MSEYMLCPTQDFPYSANRMDGLIAVPYNSLTYLLWKYVQELWKLSTYVQKPDNLFCVYICASENPKVSSGVLGVERTL